MKHSAWLLIRATLVIATLGLGFWLLDRNIGVGATARTTIRDPWDETPYIRALPDGSFATTMNSRGESETLVASRSIPIRFKPPRTYRDLRLELTLGPSQATALALYFPGPIDQPGHAELVWDRRLSAAEWQRIDNGTQSLFQKNGATPQFINWDSFIEAIPSLDGVGSMLVEPGIGRPLDFDQPLPDDIRYIVAPTPHVADPTDGFADSTTIALATVGNAHRTYTLELQTVSDDLVSQPVRFRSLRFTFRGQSLWESLWR